MGCRTGVQSGQIKVRALVDEAEVFGAKSEVSLSPCICFAL
jgi:hypothetical protein